MVTSPPYWGQRLSPGNGVEQDPRSYLDGLAAVFAAFLPALRCDGIMWVNLGDAYNTPVNWRVQDREYSTLGPGGSGLGPENSAYVKPRQRRRAFVDPSTRWLAYGSLLALPHRLVAMLADVGFLFRGEVVWRKRNPMPEGRCRRPHRQHEAVYLFARSEGHRFRVDPPVGSVWEFASEQVDGARHFSRFPVELPRRCIEALGPADANTVVLDPFAGSGTTGVAALRLGRTFLGFEMDAAHAEAANRRLNDLPSPVAGR